MQTCFGTVRWLLCKIARSRILSQPNCVIEDGVLNREPVITGEALHRAVFEDMDIVFKTRIKNVMWCEVADDSVVVIKFRPVKAGNSVEDKIEMTLNLFEGLL